MQFNMTLQTFLPLSNKTPRAYTTRGSIKTKTTILI